ncbi:MAG: DUF4125 family protein [Clostridiales Family XIII bacterium]|nr:DUF4125 family protein [Clostridiales Family XIII bacterium]
MKKLTDAIIAMEWDMFDKVESVSGRADCQDDRATFDLMRGSQFEAWSEDMLRSYLADLEEAREDGRNLLTEKYAYIMEYTAPLEFQAIKDRLPPVSDDKKAAVRRIADLCLADYDAFAAEYPLLAARSRPSRIDRQTDEHPSAEAYMLGELSTFSLRTLRLYLEHLSRLRESGRSISRAIIENSVKKYGFASLEDAEARLREAKA